MEMVISFNSVLAEIFPGGPEMKMHLRPSRVETVQTVEKREKGEWRSYGAGMLDGRKPTDTIETNPNQAFTSKKKAGWLATLEGEAKALERDEECDRPISIQFRAIVAISHKNREKRGRGPKATRHGNKYWIAEMERDRYRAWKIAFLQNRIFPGIDCDIA